MSQARAGHTIALLRDGRVLIVGGGSTGDAPVQTTEIYDPGAGPLGSTSWGPILQTARRFHSEVQFPDDSILVAGGDNQCYGCSLNVLSSAEYLPAITGSWIDAGVMAVGRDIFTMTLLPSGKALVVGGITPTVT